MDESAGWKEVCRHMILLFGDESGKDFVFRENQHFKLGTIDSRYVLPKFFEKKVHVNKYRKIWNPPKNGVCYGEKTVLNKKGTTELR